MKLAAVALPSRLPGLGGLSRSEPLVLPVEGQGNIPRLTVTALQMLQDDAGRGCPVAPIVFAGCQDEGVVGPVLKLAGFAEACQAEPIGIARPPLGILGASQGRDDDDGNPGVGELAKTARRGIDARSAGVRLATKLARGSALGSFPVSVQREVQRAEGVGVS